MGITIPFRPAWALYRAKWPLWSALAAIYVIVSVALTAIEQVLSDDGDMTPASLAVGTLAVVASMGMTMVLYNAALHQIDSGGDTTARDAAALRLGMVGGVIVSYLIRVLALIPAVAVGLFCVAAGAGGAVTVVAVLVATGIGYAALGPLATFTLMAAVDGEPARTAVSAAWQAARPHYLHLVWMVLALELFAAAGGLLAVVGVVVTVPVSVLCVALMWRTMKGDVTTG